MTRAGPPEPHAKFVVHPRGVSFRMGGRVERISIQIARQYSAVRSSQLQLDLITQVRMDFKSEVRDA